MEDIVINNYMKMRSRNQLHMCDSINELNSQG